MAGVGSEARNGLRGCVLSLAAVVAVLPITSDVADARHHYRARVHYARHDARPLHHRVHEAEYSPPSASIVVDGNSGQVLQASNPDAERHPASLTKIMTLYLLFERLEAGRYKLDTPLKVSEHAAEQAPTKLGLKAGQSIAVEDAIKGVVTRSANDAAVVIAENVAGNEDDFAKLMTQKAHALGMSKTTYVNASGLPDDDQVTTARDQALLGRAIQERFPRYYKYFATPTFVYHGVAIRNHDRLLGSVEGVDGIKTGFTRASGFNLVTSMHRDGRYLVAVVMGGHSAVARDMHMRELISAHFKEAAARRTAPDIAERTDQREEAQQAAAPVVFAKGLIAARSADPTPTATVNARVAAGSTDPIQPVAVKTVSYRIAPVQASTLSSMPALVQVAAPPAPVAAPQPVVQSQTAAPAVEAPRSVAVVEPPPAAPAPAAAPVEATPPRGEAIKAETAKPQLAKVEPAKPEPAKSEPPRARGGWLIQIGAFDAEDDARQHLSSAQIKVPNLLAAADPFTERVQKGDRSLYRARFAGFDKNTAEAACRQLKRNDFECMAIKN